MSGWWGEREGKRKGEKGGKKTNFFAFLAYVDSFS
jgi:hypothetical protein